MRAAVNSDCAELVRQADDIIDQMQLVPQLRDLARRRQMLQQQQDQAERAGSATDFKMVAQLGQALLDLDLESAQLPLSDQAYSTLAGRRDELVIRMDAKCRELSNARRITELHELAAALNTLRALHLPVW